MLVGEIAPTLDVSSEGAVGVITEVKFKVKEPKPAVISLGAVNGTKFSTAGVKDPTEDVALTPAG